METVYNFAIGGIMDLFLCFSYIVGNFENSIHMLTNIKIMT